MTSIAENGCATRRFRPYSLAGCLQNAEGYVRTQRPSVKQRCGALGPSSPQAITDRVCPAPHPTVFETNEPRFDPPCGDRCISEITLGIYRTDFALRDSRHFDGRTTSTYPTVA